MICFDHHVHYYPQFSWQCLLEYSWQNLSQAASEKVGSSKIHAAICLLETQDSRWYSGIDDALSDVAGWSVKYEISSEAKRAEHEDGRQISIIKGRQIVTQEKLEVLVIGNDEPLDNVPTLHECIEMHAEKAVVIPWAVGKWLGARGKVVNAALAQQSSLFNVGDNGGRPNTWNRVSQFDLAKGLGKTIIPGSDPLPLKNAEKRAGTSGVIVSGHLNDASGVQGLLSALTENKFEAVFSSQQSTLAFMRDQLRLRMS